LQDILYDEHERTLLEAIHSGQANATKPAALASGFVPNSPGLAQGLGEPHLQLGETLQAYIYGHVQLFHARTGAKFTAYAVLCRRTTPPQRSWVVYR